MNERDRIEQLRDILTLNVALPIKQYERELKRIKRLQIINILLVFILLATFLAFILFGHNLPQINF